LEAAFSYCEGRRRLETRAVGMSVDKGNIADMVRMRSSMLGSLVRITLMIN
jgi:hypothetical protein